MTTTRNESNATAAADKPATTIWIGTIPGIFGYGFAVTGHSEQECDTAMRRAYAKWKSQQIEFYRRMKQAYDPSETNYNTSFEDMGGIIKEIKIGQVYFDNFAE